MQRFIKRLFIGIAILFFLLLLIGMNDDAIIHALNNATAAVQAWDAGAAGERLGSAIRDFLR